MKSTLYIFPEGQDPKDERYISVGQGLFARSQYEAGDVIIYYSGDIISVKAYKKREQEGYGGYCVQLTKDLVLDCYRNRHNKSCLASLANSSTNAFVAKRGAFIPAPPHNAKIVVNRKNLTACLRAVRTIKYDEEILTCYSKSYRYPSNN